jgi:hypothetical protein
MTTRCDADAEPVACSGTESSADIQAGSDAVADHAADDERAPCPRSVRRTGERQHDVDDYSNENGVGDRPDSQALAQRPPQDQHGEADQDRPGADPEPKGSRKPLVQNVPRIQAKPGQYEHRSGHAVEDEADEQLGASAETSVGRDRGERMAHAA